MTSNLDGLFNENQIELGGRQKILEFYTQSKTLNNCST